jgi:hypothetical protein
LEDAKDPYCIISILSVALRKWIYRPPHAPGKAILSLKIFGLFFRETKPLERDFQGKEESE